MRHEKNFKADDAGRKYFSFPYTAIRLFEHMCKTGDRFSVRKLMKFTGVHVQSRKRVHESLALFIDLEWVRAIPGNPILYEVTEEGVMAYPEAKRFLDFHDSIFFRKWGPQGRPWDGDLFMKRRR